MTTLPRRLGALSLMAACALALTACDKKPANPPHLPSVPSVPKPSALGASPAALGASWSGLPLPAAPT